MKKRFAAAALVLAGLWSGGAPVSAAVPEPGTGGIDLSPPTGELLRQEMRLIAGGMQAIALAIAMGDWDTIREAGERIGGSYIMAQRLTPSQAEELEAGLPARFKALDTEFHARAARLGAAAAERDAELVVFHYARMLEGCATCHAEFAGSRFTGFSVSEPDTHRH